MFFKQIRTKFGNKPVYTDGAYWYDNDACKWLRLKHIIYKTDLKNIMERFQQIKDRTECFIDNILSVKKIKKRIGFVVPLL